MPDFNAQPLRRQILVATALLVVVLAAAVVWSSRQTLAEHEEEVRQEATSVAMLSAAYLNQYFDGLDAMASALVRHPAVVQLKSSEAQTLLVDLMKEQPLLLNAVLRDKQQHLVAAGLEALARRPDAPPPPYLAEVLRTGRPAVSEISVGPLSGKPTIGQAYPVHAADGSTVGVLAFGLDLIQLTKVFEHLALPDGSVVTLVDPQGRVLVRSRDGERYIGKSLASRGGDVADDAPQTDIDGVERFIAAVPVPRGPWSLRVGIPRTVVVARLAPVWWRNLAISVSSVLAVFILALWLSHHLELGLDRLRGAAQRIAAGDLSPPDTVDMPNLEIAQLQSAFITMAARLGDARTALDRQVEQERRMRETLQSLQRQVVRQERLAAVGVLVSGVAHELNNPLQAILGTAELLERYPGIPEDVLDEIALLKTQSSRAREIIRNLSRFGSQQPGLPSLVDLRTIIAEVTQRRRHTLEELNIALDIEASTTRRVYANVTELEQVTLNFVINAQQAIQTTRKAGGRILIRVHDEGVRVRLEVHDNGPGVPPEHEAKLFQPFFTTKPVGQGTGLGLSVSYGIVESYGGVIGCRGNEWRGATFFFALPAADEPAGHAILVEGNAIAV